MSAPETAALRAPIRASDGGATRGLGYSRPSAVRLPALLPPEPPLVPGLPVVGSLFALRGERAELMREAVARYGPVVQLAVGPRRIVVVGSPDTVGEVLVAGHDRYLKETRAYRMMRDGLGRGLLTADGEPWAKHRRIFAPSFRHDALGAFVPTIAGPAAEAGREWASLGEVDLVPALHRLAMRIAGRAFLGADVGPVADAVRESFDLAIRLTTRRVLSPLSTPLWVPSPTNLRLRRCFRTLDQVLGAIVAERRRGAPGEDFLGRLLSARDEEGRPLPESQVLDEVKTLFIAGFETVSNGIAWTLHELAHRPEWQDRVRAEAAPVVAAGIRALGDVARLPLTRRVFQESLRRYPPIWAVGRNPVRDEVIGGFTVRAGSWVFPSPYVVHHLPEHWPDPTRWDPDRFLPEVVAARHPRAFLPFLLGPRRCIGEHFAMLEGVVVVASLVAGARLEPVSGPVSPSPVVTLRPSRPILVRTRPAS